MTTIVTRSGKGSPLTNNEMDTNLTNLNSYKVEQDISGNVTITGAVYLTGSGGLGYGTGAGGTVTQATSKSTTVTLNKPTGQIEMNAAALAANTVVSFDLTNSLLDYLDVIVLSFVSVGFDCANYNVWARVTKGSATIYLKNISAGTLSQSVVLQFIIIKGAVT